MEIILTKDIKNLGFKNDLVTVKSGYGRNYLIPKGLAFLATETAKKVQQEDIRQALHKSESLLNDAKKIADEITSRVLSVPTKVGENGKIFGSINNMMIAKALDEKNIQIDRHKISVKGHPKTLGTFEAEVDLHKEVKVVFQFEVVSE